MVHYSTDFVLLYTSN